MYYLGFAGLIMLFFKPSDARIFGIVYTLLAWYFSSKMVRLILLLSPPASYDAGYALWTIISFSYKTFFAAQDTTAPAEAPVETPTKKEKKDKSKSSGNDPLAAFYAFLEHPFIKTWGSLILASVLVTYALWACVGFTRHSYEMAEHLSQPQVVLSTRTRDGNIMIIDDFREAYWWLRDNTPLDARVMAWWDYGYQINGIANRTSIADGNTWNFEHIALLGRCLLSKEPEAHKSIRHLADYVLVWTGRFIGYMSDDMAKMPQLANIAGSIYPEIDRQGYFIDRNNNPTPAARESLLYKLTFFGKDDGTIQLKYFKEAYTSKYSMIRIYKVMDVAPRTPFGKYAPELKLGQFKQQ
jgi:dolichyl-diphosphooligosaccharide--protein glycosyltransferase